MIIFISFSRTISYYFEEESSHNGIPTYRYSSMAKTVDNGTIVKENSCFYNSESGDVPSGVYDIRSCRQGAPVFMSLPHLYLADQQYHDAVVGMQPETQKHRFFLQMEPVSSFYFLLLLLTIIYLLLCIRVPT